MIQYIRDTKNQAVGLLYAEKQNGKIAVGYSLLNPADVKATKAYNARVKIANAESWQIINCDGDAPIEKYRPVFDKEVARKVASERATTVISFGEMPKKVREHVLNFLPLAARHLKGEVTLKF